MTDYTKSPREIVVDLINAATGLALAPADLVFGTPAATLQPGAVRNTQLTVTGVLSHGYRNTVQVHYNRVDIDTVPGERSREFSSGEIVVVADLVEAINAAYQINLTAEDYELDAPPAGGESGQLRMKAGSLIYYGTLHYQMSALA